MLYKVRNYVVLIIAMFQLLLIMFGKPAAQNKSRGMKRGGLADFCYGRGDSKMRKTDDKDDPAAFRHELFTLPQSVIRDPYEVMKRKPGRPSRKAAMAKAKEAEVCICVFLYMALFFYIILNS